MLQAAVEMHVLMRDEKEGRKKHMYECSFNYNNISDLLASLFTESAKLSQ